MYKYVRTCMCAVCEQRPKDTLSNNMCFVYTWYYRQQFRSKILILYVQLMDLMHMLYTIAVYT